MGFLRERFGTAEEMIAAGIMIFVLVIIYMAMVFAGAELNSAAADSYTNGDHWNNISNETGSMAEKGVNISTVGVILVVIFAACGFIIYPYLMKVQRQ